MLGIFLVITKADFRPPKAKNNMLQNSELVQTITKDAIELLTEVMNDIKNKQS